MSFQGFGNSYTNPYDTVDEVADYTDMQGDASAANHVAASGKLGGFMESPTKALITLWVIVVVLYMMMQFAFRRYNV